MLATAENIHDTRTDLPVPTPPAGSPVADTLLAGMALFGNHLLNAEADYLCGATSYVRSPRRINYRAGTRKRSLRTRFGLVLLRVPALRHMHVRPSLPKRLRRLEGELIDGLADVLHHGVSEDRLASLIKTFWTLPGADAPTAQLTKELTVLLEAWRMAARPLSARELEVGSVDLQIRTSEILRMYANTFEPAALRARETAFDAPFGVTGKHASDLAYASI